MHGANPYTYSFYNAQILKLFSLLSWIPWLDFIVHFIVHIIQFSIHISISYNGFYVAKFLSKSIFSIFSQKKMFFSK